MIYDEAFAKGGALPSQVDEQSMFQVAAMLGRNRAPEREAWPADAPHMKVMRRSLALSEGRSVPKADDPIDDDEYRRLLALVRKGTRKQVG